ncbi:MAG TPA: FAD-dependent oxidoreductase [Gammaproteobacteria bacterium]|nr:FAD-dependent oxidoreductase [Gammaproteobacteria bacterium]
MSLRHENRRRLTATDLDVLVVGGGINGASAAAALAARGVGTALAEARDFAGFTSQNSSNLIWGGFKYLESLEGGLVHRLCSGRNRLMRAYPSSVKESRFLATLTEGGGPSRSVLWLGAWIYWCLGGGFTQGPTLLSSTQIRDAEPVVRSVGSLGGVEYSDAVVTTGDARFVFNLIRGAMDNGCIAVNYLEVTDIKRQSGRWLVYLRDNHDGGEFQTRARVLVNAAGPFADQFSQMAGVSTRHHHVLSKGIHLVVDRLTDSGRILAFMTDDRRPFFVVPMGGRSCIGTTDTRVTDPHSQITDEDRNFVLDNANRCLDLPRLLTSRDVIAERCGVRPLAVTKGHDTHRDFLKLSRQHVVETTAERSVVTILGGKLTDCIRVGEEVRDAVLGLGVLDPQRLRPWYGEPDSDVKSRCFSRLSELGDRAPAITAAQRDRFWAWYGERTLELVDQVNDDPASATSIFPNSDIIWAELDLMQRTEMIVSIDDFLRRRTLLAQTTDARDLAVAVENAELDRLFLS